jgi:acyl-CoA reductase-like NAD-dependent aldehyde dehydrogenase
VERLAARSARVKIGMPLDESDDMDSLIHEQHMDKVLGYIESGSREVGFWREAQGRGRL